jgi:hypothetical protein
LQARTEKVKNAGIFTGGFIARVGSGFGKAWVDGKSDRLNFFHRNSQGVKGSCGGRVGNDPEVCRRGGPESVHGNRIGDDGDQLKRVTKIAGKEGDEVGIDREGECNDFWAMGFDQFAKSEVGRSVREEGVFDEREVVAREVEEVPSMRISVDQGEVEATKKIVEDGT